MGKTYRFMIGAGAIGGGMIVASANALAFLDEPFNYIMFLVMALAGLAVMYYARFG